MWKRQYLSKSGRITFFFFLIDKHQNILEKAKKPHVYRGYTQKPKKES